MGHCFVRLYSVQSERIYLSFFSVPLTQSIYRHHARKLWLIIYILKVNGETGRESE